jgi:hypothetical protein
MLVELSLDRTAEADCPYMALAGLRVFPHGNGHSSQTGAASM